MGLNFQLELLHNNVVVIAAANLLMDGTNLFKLRPGKVLIDRYEIYVVWVQEASVFMAGDIDGAWLQGRYEPGDIGPEKYNLGGEIPNIGAYCYGSAHDNIRFPGQLVNRGFQDS